jgi:hypothetical protein
MPNKTSTPASDDAAAIAAKDVTVANEFDASARSTNLGNELVVTVAIQES